MSTQQDRLNPQQAADSREVNVIELLRRRGVSWRGIAWRRGLGSAQRAQQRFQQLARRPTILIDAFRVVGEVDILPIVMGCSSTGKPLPRHALLSSISHELARIISFGIGISCR